jgi:hypothetical protein
MYGLAKPVSSLFVSLAITGDNSVGYLHSTSFHSAGHVIVTVPVVAFWEKSIGRFFIQQGWACRKAVIVVMGHVGAKESKEPCLLRIYVLRT